MKIEKVDFFTDRFCNECVRGQNDVKEIYIGRNTIALCKDCRKNLRELLKKEVDNERK